MTPAPAGVAADHDRQSRALEWLLASMMVLWGMGLLMPWDTFANPSYRYLAALASEQVWGVFSVAIGVVRSIGLYVNGEWRRSPLLRLAGAVLGVIWWAVLFWLLWLSVGENGPAAALWWYPLFLGAELYACDRTGRDAANYRSFRRGVP